MKCSARPDKKYIWILLLFCGMAVEGQNIFLPLGSPAYETLDRQFILSGGSDMMFSAIKPYRRADVARYAIDRLGVDSVEDVVGLHRILLDNNEFTGSGMQERFNQREFLDSTRTFYVQTETVIQDSLGMTSKRPLFNTFYRTPAHFYELDTEDFYLRVNPLLHVAFGQESDDDDPLFINKRGIEVRGGIDGKVFFATNIIETQLRPPTYVVRWIEERGAVPDAGLFKNYRSSFFDFDNGYDYLNSNGYIGFNISEHVGLQLGHGKNMLGDGYRSLFLSDFAKNYFYLKLNTRVWKFHYQNIFGELSASERPTNLDPFPKKYIAAHYLSFKARENLSFGLFEAVILAREGGQFDLQYLNPIILYRTIEQHVGSPDNVLIGLNARWDIWKTASIYGQLIFDEFKVSEFFAGDNWWGNKFGIQAGVKYINAFGIHTLDLQLEYNRVRPYTYTHYDSLGSYSHFNQPLAHPLGANFTETIAILRFRPLDKLDISAKVFFINTAEDTEEQFFGTNILRPNNTRIGDYGIEQGQGVPVSNNIVIFNARYMLKHHLYLEAQYFNRNYDAAVDASDLTSGFFTLGLRWNLFDPVSPEF